MFVVELMTVEDAYVCQCARVDLSVYMVCMGLLEI